MISQPISPEMFTGLPAHVQKQYNKEVNSPDEIIETVANHFGYMSVDLLGISRKKAIVEARHIAIYFIRLKNPMLTFKKIGQIFGKDHSTIIFSVQMVQDQIRLEKGYKEKINTIQSLL